MPSSRTRLFTEESVSELAIKNAAIRPTIVSAVPQLAREVLGVDQRAAHAVGEVLARGHVSAVEGALDPRRQAGDVTRAVGAHIERVGAPGLARGSGGCRA